MAEVGEKLFKQFNPEEKEFRFVVFLNFI